MTALLPSTVKEVINAMLEGIGSSPVSTIEDSGDVDVVSAKKTLDQVSREVQKTGYNFNTEEAYPLVPSYPSKEITLPANAARVDPTDKSKNYVQRGLRLYDKDNHSYTFDETVKVDMILLLPFEDLPETSRSYIALKSIRKFVDNKLGDQALHQYKKEDELEALRDLMEAELTSGDYNLLSDSWSAQEIVDRNI